MSQLQPVPPAGQQASLPTPPGWYPSGVGLLRYWDGRQWTNHTAPDRPSAMAAPQPVHVHVGAQRAMHVSGMTTGEHILWAVLTVCTAGLAAPIWALRAFAGRRRIS